jgi:hypothetical protein
MERKSFVGSAGILLDISSEGIHRSQFRKSSIVLLSDSSSPNGDIGHLTKIAQLRGDAKDRRSSKLIEKYDALEHGNNIPEPALRISCGVSLSAGVCEEDLLSVIGPYTTMKREMLYEKATRPESWSPSKSAKRRQRRFSSIAYSQNDDIILAARNELLLDTQNTVFSRPTHIETENTLLDREEKDFKQTGSLLLPKPPQEPQTKSFSRNSSQRRNSAALFSVSDEPEEKISGIFFNETSQFDTMVLDEKLSEISEDSNQKQHVIEHINDKQLQVEITPQDNEKEFDDRIIPLHSQSMIDELKAFRTVYDATEEDFEYRQTDVDINPIFKSLSLKYLAAMTGGESIAQPIVERSIAKEQRYAPAKHDVIDFNPIFSH